MTTINQEKSKNGSYWEKLERSNSKIETWPEWKKNIHFNGDRIHNDRLITSGLKERDSSEWLQKASVPKSKIKLRKFLQFYLPYRYERGIDKVRCLLQRIISYLKYNHRRPPGRY